MANQPTRTSVKDLSAIVTDERQPLLDDYDSFESVNSHISSSWQRWWGKRGSEIGPFIAKRASRFVVDFPRKWESWTRSMDDWGIALCQRPCGGRSPKLELVLYYVALGITHSCGIELGVIAPFVMSMIGMDTLAIEILFVMLMLAVISQIPKRFVWRYRPWMSGRAYKYRDDRTSSFPSRAVMCCVLYVICIWLGALRGYRLNHHDLVPSNAQAWWFLIPVLPACAASWARIYLGCHYPSDCIVGGLMGYGLYGIAYVIRRQITALFHCASCFHSECYSPPESTPISFATVKWALNWWMLLWIFLGGLVLAGLVSAGPLHFWEKSSHVLGSLFAIMTFHLFFLCSRSGASKTALPLPSRDLPWYGWIITFVVAIVVTVIGNFARGKWHLPAFIIIFALTGGCLGVWRMWWQ